MSRTEARATASTTVTETPRSRADDAMDRYASGDSRAFEIVFDEVAPAVERFLDLGLSPERRAAIVAETLLTMHRQRGTFIRGSAVLPWAFAIAERLRAI